jgi:hypothetical protein
LRRKPLARAATARRARHLIGIYTGTRANSILRAAASVVDMPGSSWEDLITLTILDLYEMGRRRRIMERRLFGKIKVP